MHRMFRWLAALVLAALIMVGALALAEAAQLPSASSLDPFVPAERVILPAQSCRDRPILAVPTATLLGLEPALRAAEGPHPRYLSSIARSALCRPGSGMLRFHLDEALMMAKLRLRFNREQQFTLFLNRAYFGGDVPGVASASQRLFQHPPNQLTLPQQALLMGMIQSPIRYHPSRNPSGAYARRNAVIDRMERNGDITMLQAETAKQTHLDHELDHAQ